MQHMCSAVSDSRKESEESKSRRRRNDRNAENSVEIN